jgi:hypothetical protein
LESTYGDELFQFPVAINPPPVVPMHEPQHISVNILEEGKRLSRAVGRSRE